MLQLQTHRERAVCSRASHLASLTLISPGEKHTGYAKNSVVDTSHFFPPSAFCPGPGQPHPRGATGEDGVGGREVRSGLEKRTPYVQHRCVL